MAGNVLPLARRSLALPVVRCAGGVFVALNMPGLVPNEKRKYLLIDVSNSFTKLAFASREKLDRTERIATARLSSVAIRKLIQKGAVEQVIVSSVVPKKDALIRRAAGLAFFF